MESTAFDFIQRVGGVGYWEYDAAKRHFWLPPESLKLLSDIIGGRSVTPATLNTMFVQGEQERFESSLEAAVAQRLPLHQELRLRDDASGKRWLSVRGAPLSSGDDSRYAGIFQDITRQKLVEAEREQVIGQFDALLGSLRVGVTVFDNDLRLLFWNDQFHDIIGLPRGSVYKYARYEDLLIYPARRGEYGPGEPEALVRQRAELARRFEPHRFERHGSDGRVLLVEGYPFGFGGEVSGFVTTYTDITEQKRVEEKLLRQNNVLNTIIDNFPGAISLFDADLRLAAHNDQFRTLLELPESLFEKADLNFEDLIRFNAGRGEYGQGDPEEQVAAIVARARNFQPHKIERVRPSGLALEIRGMPLPGGGFVTIYIDITERRRAEERIRVMALQDALTGLPNRLNLSEKIEQAIERERSAAVPSRQFALMFLDLDGFKKVNDSLGHDVGDELLVRVADELRATVRETDVVARLGGDEFVILLHDLDSAARPADIARDVVSRLATPFVLSKGTATIGTSIGIALYPDHGTSRETLLRAADEAMYAAKNSGRGAWRFAST